METGEPIRLLNMVVKHNHQIKHMYKYALAGVGVVGLLAFAQVSAPEFFSISYDTSLKDTNKKELKEIEMANEPAEVLIDTREVVTHVPLPLPTKTIYMTSCVVGTHDFRDRLVALIDDTEINSVIIDIKDYSGTISFPPEHDSWKSAWVAAKCGAGDMKAFLSVLHSKNIYVIGRVTVFQDPFYTAAHPELAVKKADGVSIWKDNKGLSFIDVGAKPYWDHLVDLSADAYNIGFDEINYDYVRYPSDGPMSDISFPQSMAGGYGKDKQANLEAFFKYLNEQLDDETLFSAYAHTNTGKASSTPYTSVDLFGMTTTNTDDLSIGQVIERTAPYFDFIAPMVYPSHYPKSFLGLGNPNDYPYKVVHFAMQSGVNRMTASTTVVNGFLHERIGTSTPAVYKKPIYTADKLRTWIQDFDYGGDYDATDVRNEIQASVDAGVNSWMLWAPSNIYTKAALQPAPVTAASAE